MPRNPLAPADSQVTYFLFNFKTQTVIREEMKSPRSVSGINSGLIRSHSDFKWLLLSEVTALSAAYKSGGK